MTSIDTRSIAGVKTVAAVVIGLALWAAPAARAEEGAPAPASDGAKAGGDGAKAQPSAPEASPGRDIELAPPRHGPAGLWRQNNVRGLGAPSKAAGPPSPNIRPALSPLRPRVDATIPRNAIGAALAPQAHEHGSVISEPNRPTITGATGHGGATAHPAFVPPYTGQALHGATINGTMMRRTASGAGSIGGPAKDHMTINGTLLKPKH